MKRLVMLSCGGLMMLSICWAATPSPEAPPASQPAEAPAAVEGAAETQPAVAKHHDVIDPEVARQRQETWLRAAAAMNGPFEVSGKVVDDDGNPLENVSVVITKGKATGSWELEQSRQVTTVSGDFTIHFGDCKAARLEFSKQDYLVAVIDVLRTDPVGVVSKHPQRVVVLEKAPSGTPLVDASCTLELFTSGEEVILREGAFTRDRSDDRVERLGKDAPRDAAIMRLSVSRGPKGFETVQVPRGGESEVVDRIPRAMSLTIADGGFIRYDPDVDTRGFREMKVAPENGYHPKLQLAGEYHRGLPGINSRSRGIFFYFKHKGLYGKGAITGVDVDDEGTGVLVGVELFVQRDGTRNVATGEYP